MRSNFESDRRTSVTLIVMRVRDRVSAYFFQVGDAKADERAAFISPNGRLLYGCAKRLAVRTFPTLRAANEFFKLMAGRYAGQELRLRAFIEDWEAADYASRSHRRSNQP
jgi:hypothetical protein